jgi:L-amino acid N-acyltransferase YncA
MEVRNAIEPDLQRITDIYNEVLTTSTAIFNDRPALVEERREYWKSRVQQGYPLLVAVEGDTVLGYATFGDFRSWPGYRFTVEGTIHIHTSARRNGVGTALLKELVGHAKTAGKHVMIAGVDATNKASLSFLEGFGFERVGHLREVGYKFDKFLDLVFLQIMLADPFTADR